jgi:hypothetical protein
VLKPTEEAIRELSYENVCTLSAEIPFLYGTKSVMNSYSNNTEDKTVDSFANSLQKVIHFPFPFYQNVNEGEHKWHDI